MLETPFPFFICKKPGEIPIFGTFLAKKLIFLSILVYVHWKSDFWVRPCLKTSLWRHTLTDFHDFGINEKRRPYPIPWYQTITLWARQFQVHKGGGNHPPLVNAVTKKDLVGRGLNPTTTRHQQRIPKTAKAENRSSFVLYYVEKSLQRNTKYAGTVEASLKFAILTSCVN